MFGWLGFLEQRLHVSWPEVQSQIGFGFEFEL